MPVPRQSEKRGVGQPSHRTDGRRRLLRVFPVSEFKFHGKTVRRHHIAHRVFALGIHSDDLFRAGRHRQLPRIGKRGQKRRSGQKILKIVPRF